jgi:hypothetical protein
VAHGATTIAGPWPTGLQRLRARGPRGYNDRAGWSARGPVDAWESARRSDGRSGCEAGDFWWGGWDYAYVADLGEWRGGSRPGPFERQIFCPTSGSELVVRPGSDTVLTQRRSDPADRPGATRDWHADVAQLVEHHLAKVRVAGSNPVVRSEARLCGRLAAGQPRSCGGVAEWLRQGPAKPCTRVRFPSPPPETL